MPKEEAKHSPASARLAAGALFFDQEDRILCVRPSYKPSWDIPGGYVEHGESPRAACVREVEEELGITPPLGPLLAVDWAPHPDEGDKLMFLFDGGILTPEHRDRIKLSNDELTAHAFLTLDEAEAVMVARLARRIRNTAQAHVERRALYLEHGAPLPN